MKLPRSVVTSLPFALEREWLVTNGIGGFASGTVSQANTRRYHGILVASLQPPVDRVVLVSKLDVSATYRGRRFQLACNEFADGTIDPRGYQLISDFRLDEQIPTWTYSFDDAVLEQKIWMAHGRNTTYVSFQLRHAVEPLDLELIPLCTYRDYHAHAQGGWQLDVTPVKRGCQITAFTGAPTYRTVMDRGEFRAQPDWYWHFRHRAESERGLDDVEDLLAPGSFAVRVTAGEAVTFIATAEQNEPEAAGSVSVRCSNRRATLLHAVPEQAPEWIRQLTLAADQFIVSRGKAMLSADANIGASVIAGYPWFSDWGRDTMIALPGLCIATGRATEAATVLRTFAKHISQGMLPNRFPDAGTAPEYNTVDATLWYFHAIATYLDATRDYSLLKDLFDTLKEVIDWHFRGTRYAIGVDPEDGLLSAGQPNTQLTWMDARVDGHAVTARVGKPVEVNALWHFALASMAEWATLLNDRPAAAEFGGAARKAAASFAARFWNASGGHLYDVIDGPEDPTNIHGRHVDATVRPNQIFAVSLGKSLLSTEQARAVVDMCTRNLLTPVGLRSLSPNDARYAGRYEGGPAARDARYHQGTVWSWLLGAYVIAHYRTYGDHQHASALLEGIAAHLGDACLGTVSEIFDGDAPHLPRGAFAQGLERWRDPARMALSEGAAVIDKNPERERLAATFPTGEGWKKWGPYLSERQWGTVREDYSPYGNAWEYLPHDQARSRAYRWGEDGIAGLSDSRQELCLSLALWNTRDPILKERLFGLTNSEGNHGEDVKELYYYLDATPTHSYLKMLYKYPQGEFPYTRLVEENRRRGVGQPEFELLDTGLFDDDRYFDVYVEYAQAQPDDILMRVTIENRSAQSAPLHILPQLWFRNTWSWESNGDKPVLGMSDDGAIRVDHPRLGRYFLYADSVPSDTLFCDNETNNTRLWSVPERPGYWKDGFHERVVRGNTGAVNPGKRGTKAAFWYATEIQPRGRLQIGLRLTQKASRSPFKSFNSTFATRIGEADVFYRQLQEGIASPDARAVQRQAFAGMLWSKQFFNFDIPRWLNGDPGQPTPPAARREGRNRDWGHLNNADIISMPDKWEYPWYAAWDLGFHCISLACIDPEFAKKQLLLLTREWYMHPNGQMPAYEWAFGDVNPPVHAWAAWRVFQIDRKQSGDPGDLPFLERILHKLMLNFTWWVNRKDAHGRNVFQGGFLGLDNIGVFDRSSQLPTGGYIDQADGTSWMAMYALNLMRIALELAQHDPVYEDIATKFFEHFLHIAEAMNHIGGGVGLWDPQDEFFYDVLNLPDGRMQSMKVRSMVGLIPLFAVETLEPELLEKVPAFRRRLEWFLQYRPDLASLVSHWQEPGRGQRRLLSLLRGHRMKRLLKRLLDESEFLSAYGVRALSKIHEHEPYEFRLGNLDMRVDYQPAESNSGLFGGNSNWRGPIWFPVNFLIIESLQKFHHYYGDEFKIECPVGSGCFVTLNDAANELANRLTRIFLADDRGVRPVAGQHPLLQSNPHFRDHILFYEYFHGDNGRGVGASHQTGWTGLVAKLLMPRYANPPSESK